MLASAERAWAVRVRVDYWCRAKALVDVFFVGYNSCRIHQTIRMTPEWKLAGRMTSEPFGNC